MSQMKFWTDVHGGTTHFPIALLLASVLFDIIGFLINREKVSRDLHAASFYAVVLGALGSFAAVVSGLMLVDWQVWGRGKLLLHHEFVWPAFGMVVALAVWRLLVRENASRRAFGLYIAAAVVAAVCMAAAGYWGGELR